MSFESAMLKLDTEGFSWGSFRDLFPFGDVSLFEGQYRKLVSKSLEKMRDKREQELLLDLLDTQLCVCLEQTWILNEQYERNGQKAPFDDWDRLGNQLQINNYLRLEYDLRKRNSRAVMFQLQIGEMLLDRLVDSE